MLRRLKDHMVVASTMTLFALPLLVAPQQAEAQDGSRYRVMVPNLEPTDGTRDRFGERVAERLRDAINLNTHVGMSGRDMDRAARDYDMRGNDLTCIDARQLAALIDVPLVMCGSYRTEGEQLQVEASFWTVPGNEEYPVEPFLMAENNEDGARDQILASFEVMVEQVRYVAFCGDAYASSDFDSALNYCTQAVDLAPEALSARIALAGTHQELGNYEQALAGFETVLEQDEWNSNVLVNAGYSATQLGETDKARTYYTRYLEINPGNSAVRQQVAYDLGQGGDLEGALAFVREGLETDPDDLGLLESYGSYAFRVAQERLSFSPVSQDAEMDPEIAALFREASEVLMRVVEEEGAESNPGYVANSVNAYLQLNDPETALRTAERGLQVFPEAANVWSSKSTAHSRLGQTDEALAALEEVMRINPDFPSIRARMGNVLVQAGRTEEALPYLRQAVEAGEQTADQVANTLFGDAYNNGIRNDEDLAYGVRLLVLAKDELDVTAEWRQQLDFWHGYAVYRQAIAAQAPSTVQSAQATLPRFQEARRLIEAGRPYLQRSGVLEFETVMTEIGQFIDTQEAIIRRGNR